MRRPRQTLAAALLLPLLAGCGGAPQASDPPTPASSSSPSASPTGPLTEPPLFDERSNRKTEVGVKAATTNFLDALNYAAATGDTELFRTTYVGFCTRCEAIADGIDGVYDSGGAIEGGAWQVLSLRFYNIQQDVAYLDAVVNYTPQRWRPTADEAERSIPARQNVLKAFNFRYTEKSGWRVSALDPDQ